MLWGRAAAAVVAIPFALGACAGRARGAASPDELAQRFHDRLAQQDRAGIESLIFWPQGQRHESEALDYFLKAQSVRRIQSVDIVPVPDDQVLEYTRGGVRYTPSLPPVHKLVVTFASRGSVSDESAGFLVGEKDGRYYVTLAAPAPAVP
jgi:hypothetical protein